MTDFQCKNSPSSLPFLHTKNGGLKFVVQGDRTLCLGTLAKVAPIAGLPTRRSDLKKLPIKFGQCAADKDHLGDETSAAILVNPSIYTNYGLSHRDFFVPRKADELKKLFENAGYQFPNNSFEELWKKGVERDKTGLVCVETFKNLLKQIDL